MPASEESSLQRLLTLLKSTDIQVSKDAFCALRDLLNNSGDSDILELLMKEYVLSDSKKVLEILTMVKEPLDKAFLDQLAVLLKHNPWKALGLLFHVVMKTPTWLHRLPGHSFFSQFTKSLKQCTEPSFLVGGLYLLSVLLPIVPSLGQHFTCLCNLCMTAAKMQQKKFFCDENTARSFQCALHTYFHRLYGMYPCNFVSFLRAQFYGTSDVSKIELFNQVVRPIIIDLKFHPMFILSSKETELGKERWIHNEAHDLFVECSDVSLHADSNSLACLSNSWQSSSTLSSALDSENSVERSNEEADLSCGLPLVCRSLCVSHEENSNGNGHQSSDMSLPLTDSFWSPSTALGLSTPPGSRSSTPLNADWLSHRLSTISSQSAGPTGQRHGAFSRSAGRPKYRASFGQALTKIFNRAELASSRARAGTFSAAVSHQSLPGSSEAKTKGADDYQELETKFQTESVKRLTEVSTGSQMEFAEEAAEEAAEDPVKLEGSNCADSRRAATADRACPQPKSALVTSLSSNEAPPPTTGGKIWTFGSAGDRGRHRQSATVPWRSFPLIEFAGRQAAVDLPGKNVVVFSLSGEKQLQDEVIFDGSAAIGNRILRGRAGHNSDGCYSADFGALAKNLDLFKLRHRIEPLCERSLSPLTRSGSWPFLSVSVTNSDDSLSSSCRRQLSFTAQNMQLQRNLLPSVQGRAAALVVSGGFSQQNLPLLEYLKGQRCLHDLMINKPSFDLAGYDEPVASADQERRRASDLLAELPHDVRTLQVRIRLLEFELLYERCKRQFHSERNRKLHGRLRHLRLLEEQVRAFSDQARMQKNEMRQLVTSLEELRAQLREKKALLERQEITFVHNLNKTGKDKERVQSLLEMAQLREKALEEENKALRCKLGNVEQKLSEYGTECQRLAETEKLVEQLQRKLVRQYKKTLGLQTLTAVRARECRQLKNEWLTTTNKEHVSRDVIDNCRKEMAELRRCVRRDKNRLETAYSYVSEMEAQLKNKQLQIQELKSQLDDIRALHKEQIEAVQMRYHALVSVCQRQETHILELYQRLECRRNSQRMTTGDQSLELNIPQRCVAREIVSYDDSFTEGHSNDSELYLPFLFHENNRHGLNRKSVSEGSYSENIDTFTV